MSSESICSESMSRSDGEDSCGQPKKKRSRANLSNMTLEDKIKRRKLKNRVAAQAARDRKKTKMDSMEVTLAKMSEEKLKLIRENERLKKENDRLRNDNARLLTRLSGGDDVTSTVKSFDKTRSLNPLKTNLKSDPLESAVLIHDSLPQKQGLILSEESSEEEGQETLKRNQTSQSHLSMMPFVCLLMNMASPMKSSTGLRSVLPNSSQKLKKASSLLLPNQSSLPLPSAKSLKRNWKESKT